MKIRDGKNPEGWDFFLLLYIFLINGLVFDKDVTPWFERVWNSYFVIKKNMDLRTPLFKKKCEYKCEIGFQGLKRGRNGWFSDHRE